MEAQESANGVMDHIMEDKEFDFIKQGKLEFDSAGKNGIRGFDKCRYCGKGSPRDGAQHIARHVAFVARIAISRQCAGQCRGSSKARGCHRVTSQYTGSSRNSNHVH